MIKTYFIIKDSVKALLDEIEDFIKKLEVINNDKLIYTYEIKMENIDNKWRADLLIRK